MIETATFVCTICGESSSDICVYCTKDTCANHRCLRCKRCSDCCECEVPLTASEPVRSSIPPTVPEPLPPGQPDPIPPTQPEPMPQPDPEPLPHTDPLPLPGTDPQPETPGPTMAADMSHDELVRSLPELFAPDPTPALPEGSEEPDMNTPRPEVIDEIVESAEKEKDPPAEPEH